MARVLIGSLSEREQDKVVSELLDNTDQMFVGAFFPSVVFNEKDFKKSTKRTLKNLNELLR